MDIELKFQEIYRAISDRGLLLLEMLKEVINYQTDFYQLSSLNIDHQSATNHIRPQYVPEGESPQ